MCIIYYNVLECNTCMHGAGMSKYGVYMGKSKVCVSREKKQLHMNTKPLTILFNIPSDML